MKGKKGFTKKVYEISNVKQKRQYKEIHMCQGAK